MLEREEDLNEMETHVIASDGVDNEDYLLDGPLEAEGGGVMDEQSHLQEMIDEEEEDHQITLEQNEEEEAAHKILGLQAGGTEDDDIYMSTEHGHGDIDMGSESHDTATSDVSKADANSRSVYVGNVDYQVTVEDLRDHFAACGNISRVTIMMNKSTGAPMGYGFIEFHKNEGATNALMLDETELRERIIKVQIKRKNIPGMGRCSSRGGRGGSFFGGGGNTSAVGNMTEAFQSMMMNPMMMSMMTMMNQSMSGGRGGGGNRGRGRGGVGSSSNRGRAGGSNSMSSNNTTGGIGVGGAGGNAGVNGNNDLKRSLKR